MDKKKLLMLGFGDIASRLAPKMMAAGFTTVAVARSDKHHLVADQFWQYAIGDETLASKIRDNACDYALVTLTPDVRSELGYRRAYLESSEWLIRHWRLYPNNAPRRVFFVSSTSVYAQDKGETVDESSPTEPTHFSGKTLLKSEQAWLSSGIPVSIVRFSGIYGPERDYLIRQVLQGKPGSHHLTNRIHVDDCVSILKHLILREDSQSVELHDLYLASDCEPVLSSEIRSWLAKVLNVELEDIGDKSEQSSRGGHKRCNNKRLLDTNYRFIYPTFREGYAATVKN